VGVYRPYGASTERARGGLPAWASGSTADGWGWQSCSMMRAPADRSRPRPGDGISRSPFQGETDGRRGPQVGKLHLAISNSRRPRRSRVGIRARLRQPYGERLAPHLCWTVARHASTRSYRRGSPSMARQDETTCVQRWSSRSERIRVREKHKNKRCPVDRHCCALSDWA